MSFRANPRMRYLTADKLPKDRVVRHQDGTTSRKKTNLGNLHSVLEYLSLAADNKTLKLYRSQQRIARDTGIPERSVREALWVLSEAGFIVRTHRGSKFEKKRLPDEIYLRIFEDEVWDQWLRTGDVRVPKPAQDAGTKPARHAAYKTQISTTEQISGKPSDSLRSSGATWSDAGAPDLDEARVTVLEEQAATTEVVTVGDLVPVQQVMLETTSVGAEIAVVEDPAIEVGRKAWRELFSDKQLTAGQRTDRLSKIYIGALRGRKTAFHSVRAVVKVSVDAGRSDQEIAAALVRLAERPDRILSVNVLETEILTGGQQTFVSKGTQGLMAAMAWAAKYEGTGE